MTDLLMHYGPVILSAVVIAAGLGFLKIAAYLYDKQNRTTSGKHGR